MKIQFKKYHYQLDAVDAVVSCFEGQPYQSGVQYRVDPGVASYGESQTIQQEVNTADDGFRNAEIKLTDAELLENIQKIQRKQHLSVSKKLEKTPQARINLDVEMETGTGKTYVYIRTIFELNRRYGWNKFIIMVPSIAIREGIYKSFQMTTEHFMQDYHKKARFFIYDSSQLNEVETFSTDGGINVMIINIQAFNSTSNANRRIYEELDSFQSRKPIDVIKANRPILILDEPQKMEGKRTLEALKQFDAMAIFRYSATHKTTHNLIHRLDAVDAYNQKLVKRISVRGITISGMGGTHAYLYLEGIDLSKSAPVGRLSLEVKRKSGAIVREIRKIEKGDNLYTVSGEMEQYRDRYVVTNIDANTQTVEFENGVVLEVGMATGDVSEEDMRRIQIRETIRAHFEKEAMLFGRGIKALSLFFIDEVAKYRDYDEEDTKGLYARMFEEEYQALRDEYLSQLPLSEAEEAYHEYLKKHAIDTVHKGYFSIDKNNRLVDPKGKKESNDASDYDLILKDKERLLSFAEPTRFIFSHSALREGWDNPNVFTLCTLKHSDNTISRRQEIGRGLRISVNKEGIRQDDPATVHDINVLDVIANESYEEFAKNLQKEMLDELKNRPRKASTDYFKGKMLSDEAGNEQIITSAIADDLMVYLSANHYLEKDRTISDAYREARDAGTLAPMPDSVAGKEQAVIELVDQILDAKLGDRMIENGNRARQNRIKQHNLERKEFQELWKRINKKAIYQVELDTPELIKHSIQAMNDALRVRKLEYVIQRGMQNVEITESDLERKSLIQSGKIQRQAYSNEFPSTVQYDLLGKVAVDTYLTRQTVAQILTQIEPLVFGQFKENPEDFIAQAVKLINEQKARIIINQVTYDVINDRYETDLFTDAQVRINHDSANGPLEKHVLEYAVTDSTIEKNFIKELENNEEVVVYAKLPNGFKIPTPVGNYNPDWAITFKEGSVKHIYFVAETKGTTSTMEIRAVEKAKIECAQKFFDAININDKSISYGVVSSYADMLRILK